MAVTEEQQTALAKMRIPFAENQISLLPKPYKKDSPKGNCKECGGYHGLPAVHLKYVGHAALTDRLLDVDPSWAWEPLAVGADGYPVIDRDGGMWIKLTICGVTRYGYGDAQGKSGGDAMKERIGDALRNAAMRFGAALDLWHKGDLHIEEDGGKKDDKGKGDDGLATPQQTKLIFAKMKDHGVSGDALKAEFKIASSKEIKKSHVNDILAWLDKQQPSLCNECRQPVNNHAPSCPQATPPIDEQYEQHKQQQLSTLKGDMPR